MGFNFPVVEFLLLILGVGISILIFTKCCMRCVKRRVEEAQTPEQPSIFVVPMASEENDPFRPPRYSVIAFLELPPPYSEVEMKPEMFPLSEEVPPPYTVLSTSELSIPAPTTHYFTPATEEGDSCVHL